MSETALLTEGLYIAHIAAYFRELCERYVIIKKNQKDNIRFAVDFMKNQ